MKRAIAFLLIACMFMCFTGCEALEYKEAMDYYEAGEYAKALEIYRSLGDFADSAAMAELCWQKADYEKAEKCFAEGSYRQALDLYQGLKMYKDSPMKAIVCQYRIGLACIEAGAYEEALSWLEPLGSYEDCQHQVQVTKWLWLLNAIKTKGGQMELPASSSGGSTFFRANEDGSVEVAYENDAQLLGAPYEIRFSMTIQQGVRETAYQAKYVSSSTSKIQEEASGTVDVAMFSATSKIPVDTFTQTITDPEGVETVSTNTTDALMMELALAEARAAIAEGVPVLLKQTGVAMTLKELGFASLA